MTVAKPVPQTAAAATDRALRCCVYAIVRKFGPGEIVAIAHICATVKKSVAAMESPTALR
jgi:hypothetical protein